MAEKITENLWRLDIPLVGNPLKNLNSYLILGEDRSLLIDTGFRRQSCLELMEAQLAELGVDRDRMDILLTHLHSDHTGLAPTLLRPGCRMFIGRIDGRLLDYTPSDEYWQRDYVMYMANGFSREEIEHLWDTNPAQIAAPDNWKPEFTLLNDGDILRYGGHRLRVIFTPGHTPGHICLYAEDRRWLFSGDHVLFHISPNICRWMFMPDALGSYLESLDKIRDLDTELLLPAHRAVTGVLSVRVDELKAHHARRLANTLQVTGDEPGMNAYQIAARMSWKIRSRNWEEFPLTQKYFAVGETLAHLDYLVLRGRLRVRKSNGLYLYYPVEKPIL